MVSEPAGGEPAHEAIPQLHELEFAVMEQAWRLERASVQELLDKLNAADDKQRRYTTVLSVMRRLHEKGFLNRERIDRTDFYTPAISRERYAHAQTRSVLNQLVDQYGDVALAHFARQVESLSIGQLARLRELAEEAE
jgi:predicted transcriptional regulator